MRTDTNIRNLATSVAKLASDFDEYGLIDYSEDEERQILVIESMLTEGDIVTQVEILISFVDDILECAANQDDLKIYNIASLIRDKLYEVIEEIDKELEIY